MLKTFSFFFLFLFSIHVNASEKLIFDENRDDILFPITYFVNGTMDVTQNQNWFSQKHNVTRREELWDRIKDPHNKIKRDGGYKRLISDEFFSGRVAPNIFLHTIGGAYDNLWLKEYYEHYEIPFPFLFAIITAYTARLGNEAIETSATALTSHDHIADLYFFDVAGVLLASHPKSMEFLVKDMGLKAWHFQPMWDVKEDDFFNSGLNYIIRPEYFNKSGCLSPFAFFGMQNQGGVSYTCSGDKIYSAAMGVFFTDPLARKGKMLGSFFYENNKELNASLFLNGSDNLRWRLNLHPHIFEEKISSKIKLGLLFAQTYQRDYAAGININLPFGLGMRDL